MARIGAFSRNLKLLVDRALSPETRRQLIAEKARGVLAEAQAQNQAVLGRVPDHEQIVDRVGGAPLERVDPDHGVIVFRFDLSTDLFAYIGRLLVEHSPVLTGEYQDSHRLYADGVEVQAYDPAMQSEEWVFLSTVPYARKIERGLSDQAPDGVYQAVAAMAAGRYGNLAAIKFTYRSLLGGRGRQADATRQPAISVRLR